MKKINKVTKKNKITKMTREKRDLSQKVMSKIKKQEIKMKPKIYFVLGSLVLGVGMTGAVLLGTLLMNLVVFRLRVQQPFGLLMMGRPGFRPFLVMFPWRLLLLTAVLIGIGVWLLKKYDISYKKSFGGLVLGVVAMVFTLGLVMDKVGINERAQRIRHLRPFYEERFMDRDFVVGRIVELEDDRAVVELPGGKKVEVKPNRNIKMPGEISFGEGDWVRLVGKWLDEASGEFEAFGMMKLPPRPLMEGEVKGRMDLRMRIK